MKKKTLPEKLKIRILLKVMILFVISSTIYSVFYLATLPADDPCKHLSRLSSGVHVTAHGVKSYDKSICYFEKALEEYDTDICKFLDSRIVMGRMYRSRNRDLCFERISIGTLNASMCDRIEGPGLFKMCKRIVHNYIESSCEWGGSPHCPQALKEMVRNQLDTEECQTNDCIETNQRYGSCCEYCRKSVNVTFNNKIKCWFNNHCDSFDKSPRCISLDCD